MQPELSPGPRSFEQNPAQQGGSYEASPEFNVVSPEVLPASPERVEQRNVIELAPPPPAMPAPVAMPMPPQPLPATPAPAADPTVANPIAANDDDVIEKEWVDRAKQVILRTKDNPYARERAIGELQRDYLAKRYGRQVGTSGDE